MALSPDRPPPAPSLPDFRLAEKLGQGAFGSVYKALNWSTGETCAVKQASLLQVIDLSHIPKADLPDIMSEIDLLKNLHHPNIVQYRGYARTDSALYIILEYCENGSLSAIIKKFGRIPESLVGLYTLQVLHGLQYLHDEGVIHRDIKGSNILATKEGSIKLADFGVATRVGGPADSAVVGSPYWMAPEIVDQSGATTASDIWSLGALVIELLTGKPPYHFLDPMPALFRIVNDDCPPLPDGASAVVRDFLLQCFQKDANLRIGARKLLRHPWMVAAKRQVDQQREAGAGARAPRPVSLYDDTVQKVQQWNEALRAGPPGFARPDARASGAQDENRQHRSDVVRPVHLRRPSMELASALKPTTHLPTTDAIGAPAVVHPRRGSLPFAIIQPEATSPLTVDELRGEAAEAEDNWDGDFEEGISVSKIVAIDHELAGGSSASEDGGAIEDTAIKDGDQSNSLTIRPLIKLSLPGGANVPSSVPPSRHCASLTTVMEDYSDLVGKEEADPFSERIKDFQEKATASMHLRRPASVEAHDPTTGASLSPSPSSYNPPSLGRASVLSIDRFSEHAAEDDDYSDVFGRTLDDDESDRRRLNDLRLETKLSSRSWLGDEDSDEDDPFALVDAEDADGASSTYDPEADLEANLARDKLAQQCILVSDLVETVARAERLDGDWEVREAALQLTGLVEESAAARSHFVKSHGILVVLEALRGARSRDILSILLRIINLVIASDSTCLEKIALVGGCPVVMGFSSKRYSREIRLEAALFIGAMCRTSLLTLQMFVSCQGLRTLVEMLDENYREGKDLVWMAIDGISRVFEMHGPTPRNDFCRILAQEGVLEPLSTALLHVCEDDDDLAESAKAKIVHILLLFAQSDHKVKEAMARRTTALRLVKAATKLEPELLACLLKTIKNLSMLPLALDVLQNAGTIDMLVSLLGRSYRGRLGAEIQNHAVNTLFNLCRLSKVRQEETATAGAIPLLQRIVQDSSPLKQFALPILCDFAHAGKTCRKLLWQHDGVAFYLHLLRDTFWVNPALEAILAWLQDEPARVEDCLLEESAIEALVRLFCRTKAAVFDNLLEPLHKILRASSTLASKLAVQSGFLKRIVERLERASKAVVRLNLLRITKTAWDALTDRRDRDKAVKVLAGPVSRLADEDKAVLSRQLAKSLASDFGATKEETKRSFERRVMRRAASEGGPPLDNPSTRRLRAALDFPLPPSPAPSSPASSMARSPTPARQRPALPPGFAPTSRHGPDASSATSRLKR